MSRALKSLNAALAEQRVAVAAWREALGELKETTAGLGESLQRYRTNLGSLSGSVSELQLKAQSLEQWADGVLPRMSCALDSARFAQVGRTENVLTTTCVLSFGLLRCVPEESRNVTSHLDPKSAQGSGRACGADAICGHAETAVQWLRGAGMRIFEITMTVPGAVALIARLASDPDLLIGAGTVPDAATAQAVSGCGGAVHRRSLGRSDAVSAVPRG